MVAYLTRAVAALHHHVHNRQHASKGLQSDGWNRFIAGRATCSVDDQVGDATCGQGVSSVIRWYGAEEPRLPVCCRHFEPHAQTSRYVNGIGDGTVKSDFIISDSVVLSDSKQLSQTLLAESMRRVKLGTNKIFQFWTWGYLDCPMTIYSNTCLIDSLQGNHE